jgi:hypothetical protein
LASCTLKFGSNLTKIIFQGKQNRYLLYRDDKHECCDAKEWKCVECTFKRSLSILSHDFLGVSVFRSPDFYFYFCHYLPINKLFKVYYIDIDEIPWFPSWIKTIISLVKLPFLFHSRYISHHFVVDVIWRLPVWNVKNFNIITLINVKCFLK